jgi:hypothetical protein
MYWNDFNVISSSADIKLFTDPDFQMTVYYCINEILRGNPGFAPDTLWIDTDNNILHLWEEADREGTDIFTKME